jgi:WD40 repeat protein
MIPSPLGYSSPNNGTNARIVFFALVLQIVVCWPSVAAAKEAIAPGTFFIAFTPDSARLVVASHDGGLRLLGVPDLNEIRSFSLEEGRRLRSVATSTNGRWLAAADDSGNLRIWDLETGEPRPGVPLEPRESKADSVYIFAGDTLFLHRNRFRVWDVASGTEDVTVRALKGADRMALSPDGRSLAVFGCDGSRIRDLCVYAIDAKSVVTASWKQLFGDKSPFRWQVADLVFTEDGRILVTVSEDEPHYLSRVLRANDLEVLDDAEMGFFERGEIFVHLAKRTPPVSRLLRAGDLAVLQSNPTVDSLGSYRDRAVSADELRAIERELVAPQPGWQSYVGLRSAPCDQLEVVSPDRKWKATSFNKRLYLYRVTDEKRLVMQTYMRVP